LSGPAALPQHRRRHGVVLLVGDRIPGVAPMPGALGPWDDQPMAKTVLIVDDHAPFRAVARALLQLEGFDVVGEAADAYSALDAVRRLRPSVVLLDVQLPDLDGFEVAHRLARPGTPRRSCWCPAATARRTASGWPTAQRAGSLPKVTCRAPRSPHWSAERCAGARLPWRRLALRLRWRPNR
jgi:CheY-like chemotaxis protein